MFLFFMCCVADADADTEYWLFALHSILPRISRSLFRSLFLQYNTHNDQHVHYNLYQYKLPHIRLEQ